jgi:hypothetical protein
VRTKSVPEARAARRSSEFFGLVIASNGIHALDGAGDECYWGGFVDEDSGVTMKMIPLARNLPASGKIFEFAEEISRPGRRYSPSTFPWWGQDMKMVSLRCFRPWGNR